MKNFFTLIFIIGISIQSFGQVPHMMKYQAVVRDNDGTVISDQNVAFRFSVLKGSESGTAVYVEEHTGQTNSNGLIDLTIGDGTSSDDFTTIDWGNDDYFLKIELDPAGSSSYQQMGVSQILSVPYAIYAQNIPDNSVDGDKLAENSIDSSMIKKGAVAGSDIALNSIDSTKIKDGSISSDDLAGMISTDHYNAYQDLVDENRLDNNWATDLLTRSQADERYNKRCQFAATNTAEKAITTFGYQVGTFDTVKYNLGNHFSIADNHFIAPVEGIYNFSASLCLRYMDASSEGWVGLMVNGSKRHWLGFGIGDGIYGGSKDLSLEEGDTVEVIVYSTDTDYSIYDRDFDEYSTFSGHLVHQIFSFAIIIL